MLMIILIVLLLAALVGGGFGHSRYGYVGWSPAGLIVVILLVLYFTGYLHR
jgi:F0F1-type ATP synthase assembly protein I